MSFKVAIIVGARPNFIKAAPIYQQLAKTDGQVIFIHTGQHYDRLLSDVFIDELSLPKPDFHLGVGSEHSAIQLSEMIRKLHPVLSELSPNLVVVVGDVTSTLGGALAAKLGGYPLAHVESGLRSFDDEMPEERNRRLTDTMADLLFVTEQSGMDNLRNENCRGEAYFVGNTMIDTLLSLVDVCRAEFPPPLAKYAVATFHRKENVDRDDTLDDILLSLEKIGEKLPVFFPVHPRTRKRLEARFQGFSTQEFNPKAKSVQFIEPMSYKAFMSLMSGAAMVLTDSGGIQEETTVLGVPCLTLRKNTERPSTIEFGTNTLLGTDPEKVLPAALSILDRCPAKKGVPPLWDGMAGERIVGHILNFLAKGR